MAMLLITHDLGSPNACPDEEGIKTWRPTTSGRGRGPNACPDEEGIKTVPKGRLRGYDWVRTLALTKKGLRPAGNATMPAQARSERLP